MAEIFSFNEAVVAAANAFIATGGLTPTFTSVAVGAGTAAAPSYSFSGDPNTGIYNSASDQLAFATAGAQRWVITSAGHLLAGADNALDIGASGANRPRDFFLGRNANIGGTITAAATGYYGFSTRNLILSPADGTTRLSNWAGTSTTDITLSGASGVGTSIATFGGGIGSGSHITVPTSSEFQINSRLRFSSPANGIAQLLNAGSFDFTRLILGTNDASGVAIKKSGTTINLVLGDDSGRANLTAGIIATTNSTVAGLPTAATAGVGARSMVTDALGPTFGAAAVGGGAVKVPVYSDGAAWLVG